MSKQQLKIYQMFCGYLHQDWIQKYVWDEGEKPDFKVAIEDYKEDYEETPEVIETSINELTELIKRNYDEDFLSNEVFRQLDIAINPEAYGYTYQEFLEEVLNLLKADKVEKPEELNSQTEEDLLPVYPPRPAYIIPAGIKGLLTVYFAKDYDELVEQFGKMRLITQIVAKYKEDRDSAAVRHCMNEVSSLVAHEHNETYLRNKIREEYGVKIPISKLGGSYQVFLERLHEELVGKRLYY